MLKYHSLVTILVFAFCILGVLAQLSNDTPSPNSTITCQDNLNYMREEFSIDICLVNQGSQYTAIINLQNNNTFEAYQLKVSQSYIEQNIQMSVIYQNPFKFFSMLKEEECNITTNSDAQILLKYKLFRMLRLIPKQKVDEADIMQRQLQVQKDSINRISQQSNSEILKLNNNITQVVSKADLLKTDIDTLIAQINQETLTVNQTILQERISTYNRSIQIQEIKALLGSEIQLLQRLNTNNLQQFHIQKFGKIIKIRHNGINGQWQGYLRAPHIQPGRITRLQVRQSKALQNQALYGVSTDKVIGSRWFHYHAECKTYYSYGWVYQNGWYTPGVLSRSNHNGMVVTIVADLINWKVSWEIYGRKVAQAEISAAMRANKLYFIIGQHHKDDEMDILEQ